MRTKPEGDGGGGGERPGGSKMFSIRRIEYSSKKGEEDAAGKNSDETENKKLSLKKSRWIHARRVVGSAPYEKEMGEI